MLFQPVNKETNFDHYSYATLFLVLSSFDHCLEQHPFTWNTFPMAHLPHHKRHELVELQFAGYQSPKLHKQIQLAFDEFQIGERSSLKFLFPYQWDAKCLFTTHRILWKNHGYKPVTPFKTDAPIDHELRFFDAAKKSFDTDKPSIEIVFFQPCVLKKEKIKDCPHCGETTCDAWTYLADIQHAFQYEVDSSLLGDAVPAKQLRHKLYRAFIRTKYGPLQRHQRRPVPDCVVELIRTAAPNPPSTEYVGFQDSPTD